MRHKRMAGTKFLLCSRKRKPSLTTFTKHLLHSKSTYFYRWGSSSGKLNYVVPATCGLALLVGMGMMFNPMSSLSNNVYAETPAEECVAGKPVLALDLSGDINLSKVVDEDIENGVVSYISKEFTVTSCRTAGYKIFVQANSDKLYNQDAPDALVGVGKNISPNNFPNDTWGYAVANASTDNSTLAYSSMPEPSQNPQESFVYGASTEPNGSNLKISFAAKFGNTKTSGHYSTNVLLSVVANAWDIEDIINGVTTMQRFADIPNSCNRVPASGVQLVDDRTASGLGSKIYWVAKLNDGNCWMTQNLDLSLTTNTVLKSDDTDMPNGLASYRTSDLAGYHDPGEYIYATEKANTNLPSSQCGYTVSSCPTFFQEFKGSVLENESAHYLIGKYYSYVTATLGQRADNSGSICPKGWRLPTSAEFTSLISTSNANLIRRAPYYFVPGGGYAGGIYELSSAGYYWARTLNDSSSTSDFIFSTSKFTVSGGPSNTHGHAVRCFMSNN